MMRCAGSFHRRLWIAATLPFLALGCNDSPTEAGGRIAFETIAQTSASARSAPELRQVVRDGAELAAVWSALQPGSDLPLQPPAIDFDREMVVAVAMASQPCSARITVEEIVQRGIVLEVRLVEQPTAADCVCVAPVQPFHLVRLPRLDLPARFSANVGPPATCGA